MPKIFAIVAIIFIISSCEVQESNNIYKGPNVPGDFNNQFNSNSFSKQEPDRITKKLSNLLNIEHDLEMEMLTFPSKIKDGISSADLSIMELFFDLSELEETNEKE